MRKNNSVSILLSVPRNSCSIQQISPQSLQAKSLHDLANGFRTVSIHY